MDINYIFSFIVLSFLYKASLQSQPVFEPTRFPYSKCTKISNNVTCENLNISKERLEKASLWPPGPFAIPMSKYGCPESQSRGWSKGVLKVSLNNNLPENKGDGTLSGEGKPKSILKLQFCVKARNDPALDKGRWVPGHYNIYMKGEACPSGFEEFNRTIFCNRFETYGQLPNFIASEEGLNDFNRTLFYNESYGNLSNIESEKDQSQTYINMTMCGRINSTDVDNVNNNVTFAMLETIFMLEKISGEECPQFEQSEVTVTSEETIFCLYQPANDFESLEITSSELISDYVTLTGSIEGSDFNEGTTGNFIWYNIDLQRSLDVSMIDVGNLPAAFKFVLQDTGQTGTVAWLTEPSKSIPNLTRLAFYCFYDEVKWTFMYREATTCNFKNNTAGSRLHPRNVRGRFITLLFENSGNPMWLKNLDIKVYIRSLEAIDGELCNEDLGMSDDSIEDFQISASSSLPQYLPSAARPFSSGWCHDISDQTPWILVDLLTIATVEGVSVWNGRRSGNDISNTGWTSFSLYYGTRKDKLQMYTDTVFKTDVSKPWNEVQMFVIPRPVKARFIKLYETQTYQYGRESCLRFELQGCKLSGIPAINCYHSSDTIRLETEIISENQSEFGNRNITECNELCQQNDNCSVANVNDEGLCVQYMRSLLGLWKTNNDVSGHWFAKICNEGAVELFPGFRSLNGAVYTNMQYMETPSILTSIGYPFATRIGHKYKWILNLREQLYVRFVFTNVSMNAKSKSSANDSCKDKLLIGTDFQNDTKGSAIDDRFNNLIFVIETSESLIYATFIPCVDVSSFSKFRAIITAEETPGCLSMDQDIHDLWFKGRQENCTKPEMIITSLSILNLPFAKENIEERFEIHADQHHGITIKFIDFYVVCPRDQADIRSKFTIIDHQHSERTYCNTDMPPNLIISKGSRVSIVSGQHKDLEDVFLRTEGFRLQYFTVDHSFENMTDFKGTVASDTIVLKDKTVEFGVSNSTKVCSKAFNKCYSTYSAMNSWDEANSLCLEMFQYLVIVHSRNEMQYIHYLLREQRYKDNMTEVDGKETHSRAHIGLRRFTDTQKKKRYMWINNYSVTVTAWKDGFPSFGDCTRTHFLPFNTEHTWESEDCSTGHAQYFICQSQMEDEGTEKTSETRKDICENSVQAKEDMLVSTYSGQTCQSWNNLSDDAQRDFSERFSDFSLPVGSYCADPSSVGILWCYITEPNEDLWELCFLQDKINVALNKPAELSKQYGEGSGTADRAVDGNTNQNYSFDSCFHTENASINWWYVDLQLIYKLTEVRIFNRLDCCSERAKNVTILVGNSLDDMTQVFFSHDKLGDIEFIVLPTNTTGRYVKIVETADTPFHICEVQVFSPAVERINVALQKPAKMSPKFTYGHLDDDADKAVDGNTNQDYYKHSCFHTKHAPVNWWYVDLLRPYKLTEVKLYNRQDSGSVLAKNITVLVGNSLENMTQMAYSADPIGATKSFGFPKDTKGRYVKLVQTADTWFHLCEVQVFAIREIESSDTFRCSSGQIIPKVNMCDKTFDCQDFTDEVSCTDKVKEHSLKNFDMSASSSTLPTRLEGGTYLFCEKSKEWVSILAKCDGVIDCQDASDEVDCSHDHEECENYEFSCGDGNCIKLGQVCDFIPDCAGQEDEICDFSTCRLNEYACANKQCIPLDQRCNAVPDCKDKSDEIDCDFCKDSFHCDIDKCIPHRLTCDKFPDCDDGSDENNCHGKTGSSCEELWESGYHESGEYVIGDMSVFCDFSSVDNRITYEFRDIDVNVEEQALYTRSTGASYLALPNGDEIKRLIYRNDYTCNLKVKSNCGFPYHVAALTDNFSQKFAFPFCNCEWKIFEATVDTRTIVVYDCRGYGQHGRFGLRGFYGMGIGQSSQIFRWETIPVYQFNQVSRQQCGADAASTEFTDAYFSLLDNSKVNVSKHVLQKTIPIDITVGPITCSYKYEANVPVDRIDCARDNTTISLSMLCLYDVDTTGYMIGCRSGEHLQSCGNFTCPNGTVKCPGSYCIPPGYVCDGKVQCPGGEDEYDCACTDSSREVILVFEDTSQQLESETAAEDLAKQFFTSKNSIVRVLRYKSNHPLKNYTLTQRLLEIEEEFVSPFRENKCRYKSMARDLLRKLKFLTFQSSGIIFFEDSIESSVVSQLMFSDLTKPAFPVYRIIKDFDSSLNKPNRYEFVKDVHIRRWSSLFSVGYRRFPEICSDATQVPCAGGYRCSSSKQCIPLEQICDGVVNCRNGDDERLCLFRCPLKCKCFGQTVNCAAADFNKDDINELSMLTRSADLSRNPGIKDLTLQDNFRFPFMLRFNVSSSGIEIINARAFSYMNNLLSLDIGNNRIKELPENVFRNLVYLTFLNLDGNFQLSVISSSAFRGLKSIRRLRITGTKLKRIASLTFSNLNLLSIDISDNKIEVIEDYAFNNTSVRSINFEGNNVIQFGKLIFNGVSSLQELSTPAFKFCCIRPCYVDENKCYPSKNEFSSCEDLMRHSVLQAVLWLVGLTSLFGNLGSIIYRLVYDRERLKIGYGIFVTNLAAADFLMGVYLIVIAIVDSFYRKRYIFMDDQWRNSVWCMTAGILSTVSSEASVLFICLITLDRLLVIRYPFGTIRFGPSKANLCCGISWIISITLAVIPVIYTGYFQGRFYSKTGVCIALPLTRDKPQGWIYSVSIFVCLNFCAFIVVAFGQLSIFLEMRRSSASARTQMSRKRDLRVARNLIFVVTTDFLCWFPIGVMGILALTDHPISGDVYAWAAVFILPINSALNPILYTVTAIIGKESFNPSIEEQNRTDVRKEVGSSILKYQGFSRSVRTKREATSVGQVRSIKALLNEDGHLSVATIKALSRQLADYLSLLHESYIGIEQITEANTYIRINKDKARRPIVVIDSRLTLLPDEHKMQENIHQFGILLRKIIAKCDKERK